MRISSVACFRVKLVSETNPPDELKRLTWRLHSLKAVKVLTSSSFIFNFCYKLTFLSQEKVHTTHICFVIVKYAKFLNANGLFMPTLLLSF